MIERLLPSAVLARYMTPLGKDIAALFDAGGWVQSEYVLRHADSGIDLWTGSGYEHFKLYRVRKDSIDLEDKQLEGLLNRADRAVIWRIYQRAIKNSREQEVEDRKETISNLAKMAYIKGETNE